MIDEQEADLSIAEPLALTPEQALMLRCIEQFLYYEARLQDLHAYDAWESLWTDDAIYWIPANGENPDPETQMSYVYDNRSRIGVRIKQLKTGKRHTQTPRSQLARIIANIEFVAQNGNEFDVRANSFIHEESLRGAATWAARNDYRLRLVDGTFRLVRKKVVLVNNNKPIYTLSFLV
jgi:3-phenylpropionate/cinnamic acid dioxygenase small subunit